MSSSPLDALFASDLAAEVRSEFEELASHGLPVADATAHVLAHFRHLLGDPDDGPVIILALAALQLRYNQLHASLRDAARDLIATGEAARAWRARSSATDVVARKALLAALDTALEGARVVDDAT